MTASGAQVKTIQVHPTRFCNLRCVHCYSSSGPENRGELEASLLEQAIADAAALGYKTLSVSGGEPLLYSGLRAICQQAKRQNMTTTVVTNGTVMTADRLKELAGAVDFLRISIDGVPHRHNRIRRAPGAFESILRSLPLLRRVGIPFGFDFTLTRDNLEEVEWAADFAVSQGARLLQIHPIEEYGRAATNFAGQGLPDEHMATVWMIVECLREIHRGKLAVQFDGMHRYALPVQPAEVARWAAELAAGNRSLAEVVSPLVVEADGTVVPLRYAFARSLVFGSLRQQNLRELAGKWIEDCAFHFCEIYQTVLEEARISDRFFANIYELLSAEAVSSPASIRCEK